MVARRNWLLPDAWSNAFATTFARIFQKSMQWWARGTGEDSCGSGDRAAPAKSSPFNILTSRPEGDAREAQGRFSRESWDGAIADLPNYLYDEATPRVLATPKYTAYIKIAEGCDHPCSFCIIPQLRGKFRSRRFESVIAEAERLAGSGVREITLIGQDTTCYGEDFGLE